MWYGPSPDFFCGCLIYCMMYPVQIFVCATFLCSFRFRFFPLFPICNTSPSFSVPRAPTVTKQSHCQLPSDLFIISCIKTLSFINSSSCVNKLKWIQVCFKSLWQLTHSISTIINNRDLVPALYLRSPSNCHYVIH